jgi:hypothetical protein
MRYSGFMPKWKIEATRIPSIWVGTPKVPGGLARPMMQDDFGNLYDVSFEKFGVAVANADH